MFTQRHAEAIAKKLKCQMREGRAQRHADVFEDGRLVATFGIRRASKEVGHGHLPMALHLSQKQCREMHDCTVSREQYIQLLREKNLLG